VTVIGIAVFEELAYVSAAAVDKEALSGFIVSADHVRDLV
jgi:hypothetical protein